MAETYTDMISPLGFQYNGKTYEDLVNTYPVLILKNGHVIIGRKNTDHYDAATQYIVKTQCSKYGIDYNIYKDWLDNAYKSKSRYKYGTNNQALFNIFEYSRDHRGELIHQHTLEKIRLFPEIPAFTYWNMSKLCNNPQNLLEMVDLVLKDKVPMYKIQWNGGLISYEQLKSMAEGKTETNTNPNTNGKLDDLQAIHLADQETKRYKMGQYLRDRANNQTKKLTDKNGNEMSRAEYRFRTRMDESKLINLIKESTSKVLKEYMDSNLSKVRQGIKNATDEWGNWADEPYGEDKTEIVKNQWMIHFSDMQNTRNIAKNGFTMGNRVDVEPKQVTYNRSKWDRSEKINTFNYAYLASDVIYEMSHNFSDTFLYYLSQEQMYGFVMFKANGFRFYHEGDSENQVVFNNVQKNTIVEIQYLYDTYCVLDNKGARNKQNPDRYKKGERGSKLTNWNVNPKAKFDGVIYHSKSIENVIRWVMTNYEQYKNKIGN